jgi:hypothetical protein
MGGIEKEGPGGKIIEWTQPEILLYDDDPLIRISYPDLVEDDGNYYITETQKDIARVHLIDEGLLEGLWEQFYNRQKTIDGLAVEWTLEKVQILSTNMTLAGRTTEAGTSVQDSPLIWLSGLMIWDPDKYWSIPVMNLGKACSSSLQMRKRSGSACVMAERLPHGIVIWECWRRERIIT